MSADTPALAEQLLEAQVAYVLAQLDGESLDQVIEHETDEALALLAEVPLDQVVAAEDVTRIANWLLQTVPTSTAASTLTLAGADVVYDGPQDTVTLEQLVSRDHADALVGEVLALHPVLERALEQLTDSPRVGQLASRFLTKIVGDVLQANRTAAEKIPGMGSIMSLGSSAASMMIGAADKPLQMVGDTAGKGATFAVRRLNAVVIDTIRDPLFRDAMMEVWDQHADTPIGSAKGRVLREDVHRIAGLLQDIVIAAAPEQPVQQTVAAFVQAFFGVYGEYPVTTLLLELDITRDEIVSELQVLVPRVIEAAREQGRLEGAIRARLQPFFASPEVAAILEG